MATFFFGCSRSSSSSLLSTLKIVTRQKVGRSTVTQARTLQTLSLQKIFFSSESLLHEPQSSDLLTIWGYRGPEVLVGSRKTQYCKPYNYWRNGNVAVPGLFIYSCGKRGGNYLEWRKAGGKLFRECVCVLLCFVDPILGNRYGPGVNSFRQ